MCHTKSAGAADVFVIFDRKVVLAPGLGAINARQLQYLETSYKRKGKLKGEVGPACLRTDWPRDVCCVAFMSAA